MAAGQCGCAFVTAVLSAATILVLVGSDVAAVPSTSNRTCYSADVQWRHEQVQSYRFNGSLREAPLPRHTRWHAESEHDWAWPPEVVAPRLAPVALWYVRGVAYDLSVFADRHPGGHRYILNTANSDITELFEAHHIGTTAAATLAKLRHRPREFEQSATPVVYRGHTSTRFKALKRAIAASFDLHGLKEPDAEYMALFWATLGSHVGLLGACLTVPPPAARRGTSASLAAAAALRPWLWHTGLGLTTCWLGGFAHNGLHLWPRRRLETLTMYLSLSNNPFRWMQKHIVSHHVHTNTAHDGDKPVVHDFQRWWRSMPLLNLLGLTLGTFVIGLHSSCCRAAESLTMTTAEQALPLVLLALVLLVGCRLQGRRFVPRLLWTMCLTSTYTFILFQVSHYQPGTLDGDAVHATVDDWGEFQLRTTWGWLQRSRPLVCVPFLNLNLQPAHHLLPAVHHSKLREITPLIREHYPGLMEDRSSVLAMIANMASILVGRDCLQQSVQLEQRVG